MLNKHFWVDHNFHDCFEKKKQDLQGLHQPGGSLVMENLGKEGILGGILRTNVAPTAGCSGELGQSLRMENTQPLGPVLGTPHLHGEDGAFPHSAGCAWLRNQEAQLSALTFVF